ncbi:hypothetical protein KBB96_10850 [Luteolibacter ambystomatis]|uniref:Uncharacterized protein n=1 Tax=Luteolibacter ambystomatis TaxID=2824561 RepID=A0A975G4V3_9BACT|nr:hypothetical protein [Luteolibacter ambystomatis]QUE49369.1 hypothetical protein KBB96_10850 [Luteolibacter ambystomatis]
MSCPDAEPDFALEREMETLLGKLAPAEPGGELMQRLRDANPDLHETRVRKIVPFRRRVPLIAVAAAACVAGVFLIPRSATTPPATVSVPGAAVAPVKVPVESRQHLMEVTNLGVANDADNRPVRLVQTTWVDEIYYETLPGRERSVESRVRQEVLPVAVNTY